MDGLCHLFLGTIMIGVEADSYRDLRWFGENTIQANPDSRIDIQCVLVPSPRNNEYMFQRMSNEFVYEIKTKENYVGVDLQRKVCSCGEWQINGFSCAHALVAAQHHCPDIYTFFDPLFKVAKYRSTYSFTINLVPTIAKLIQMISQTVNIYPPKTKRHVGRPRQVRLKNRSEKKRIIKCSRCKKFKYHNKKICKEVI